MLLVQKRAHSSGTLCLCHGSRELPPSKHNNSDSWALASTRVTKPSLTHRTRPFPAGGKSQVASSAAQHGSMAMAQQARWGVRKRRSQSAAEAAAGVRGGAVAKLPMEVAVGVGVRAAGGCGEAAALALAVHARELEPRVDAREVLIPHAAELHDELRAVHGGAARHGAAPTKERTRASAHHRERRRGGGLRASEYFEYFEYFELEN